MYSTIKEERQKGKLLDNQSVGALYSNLYGAPLFLIKALSNCICKCVFVFLL